MNDYEKDINKMIEIREEIEQKEKEIKDLQKEYERLNELTTLF